MLEGSVRRSGNTVRITTQLINAVTGFHLWSHTYDRDLGDVLKLETDIATAVASALEVALLGDVAAKVELGGTRNPAAFDAYLRASKAFNSYHDRKDLETALAGYTEAIRLDPEYAKAFVARFWVFRELAIGWVTAGAAAQYETYGKMQADAHQAIELAPELGDAHLAMAVSLAWMLELTRASEEYERSMTLAPGSAQVLQDYGLFAVLMGRKDAGIAAARRAELLDPQNRNTHHLLAWVFDAVGQYQDEIAAIHDAKALDPNDAPTFEWQPYYMIGNFQSAREICERKPERWDNQFGLALIYDKLGRHADAENMLARMKASGGDSAAFQYAQIYAQRGNTSKALDWLEAALRLRDPGLGWLKAAPLLDPLRQEPRFQAIERKLKFPT